MAIASASKGLAITNPLVLYRALLATKEIAPDPAQHRLAIHLQKLYERLIDYEPTVEYSQRLDQISKAVRSETSDGQHDEDVRGLGRQGVWKSLLSRKEQQDSLALTRVMTSNELARSLNSPKGLMLHGEVGTGKSMLIDLFADCLPNRKKRRWHFSTFMLDVIATLEHFRKDNALRRVVGNQDYSMLLLARDLIKTSPILFLDEFQLPDRAASKIMTNLMTSFFQLGGVLIATSNRMPDELHKAAGIAFSPPPPTRLDSLRWSLGMTPASKKGRSENMFAGQGEFSEFLDVLKARCEVWEMENKRDYRRQESGTVAPMTDEGTDDPWLLDEHQDLQKLAEENLELNKIAKEGAGKADSVISDSSPQAPPYYTTVTEGPTLESLSNVVASLQSHGLLTSPPNWQPTTMSVYGRKVLVPRASNGVCAFTFEELCCTTLGPADYLTLASTFHTLILTDVPILTLLRKNEARRFITLLDALYEARCKLHVTAAAGPDALFFPEQSSPESGSDSASSDAVYSETLSEAYQDATSPFRPNALSSNPDYAENDTYYQVREEPDYTHARLQGMLSPDALEDDPPNRVSRGINAIQAEAERGPVDPDESRVRRRAGGSGGVDFGATGAFTGEDERFAFKRARSRLWEMCGEKWWRRDEEGWWRPLPRSVRRWEGAEALSETSRMDGLGRMAEEEVRSGDVAMGGSRGIDEVQDEVLFRHGASPFRTAREPPPKFSWTHVWGTMKWGKKAGAWGQGVEGLKDRKKEDDR